MASTTRAWRPPGDGRTACTCTAPPIPAAPSAPARRPPPASVGRCLPLVKGQRRRPVAQADRHERGIVLLDRAAQPLAVELLGPGQVLDPEHDGGYLQSHDDLPRRLGVFPIC